MNLKEIIPLYDKFQGDFQLQKGKTINDLTTIENLYEIFTMLVSLKDIPSLSEDINKLLENDVIGKAKRNSKVELNSSDYFTVNAQLNTLKLKLQSLYDFAKSTYVDVDNTIDVRLPNIQNFDDLTRVSNELKNALQTPVISSNTEGKVDILTAEPGSIWLTIALHTIGAVKLVGHLFRSALVMVKDYAEMQNTLEGVKRLKLGTKAMEDIVNAQKQMLDNILESEAKAIQEGYFDPNDPEVTSRLKLSIDTIRKMSNEGLLIKAGKTSSEDEDVKNIFPANDNPLLVESLIKKLSEGN